MKYCLTVKSFFLQISFKTFTVYANNSVFQRTILNGLFHVFLMVFIVKIVCTTYTESEEFTDYTMEDNGSKLNYLVPIAVNCEDYLANKK